MADDPIRFADTVDWLDKARLDLRGIEVDLAADPPLVEDALFHCQQAVEKALKGLLTWHDRPFRKTHDLGELGALCLQVAPLPEPLLRRAAPLSEYAWRFRYPGPTAKPNFAEVEEAQALAQSILAAVVSQLPPDFQS